MTRWQSCTCGTWLVAAAEVQHERACTFEFPEGPVH